MPLRVLLAGGDEIAAGVEPNAPVKELRRAVAEKLQVKPGSIRLACGARTLGDEEEVPDEDVLVAVSQLPWLDDGSERITDEGGGVFVVTGEDVKGDKKFNALCDTAFSEGEHYFEVEVLSGVGAFVGVGCKSAFGAGYKLRGLLYGGPGNLSNGGAGVRISFGKGVKPGDVLGFLVDLTAADIAEVVIWHNGRCLGTAFKAPRDTPSGPIYPIVSAQKVGDKFAIQLCPCPYDQRKREPAHAGKGAHGAEGKWLLRRLNVGPELGGYPLPAALPAPSLQIDQDPRAAPAEEGPTFRLSFHVVNRLGLSLRAIPALEGQDPYPFETVVVDRRGVMSTMMLGPEDAMQLEGVLSEHLPSAMRWLVRGDSPETPGGSLLIVGQTLEAEFVRDDASNEIEPVDTVRLP